MATGDYLTVANRLLTVVRLHADYDENNSSNGKFTLIEGGVDRSFTITPGPSPILGRAGNTVKRTWVLICDFIVRIGGLPDDISWLNFATDRDSLLRHIESYPSLNLLAGITRVEIGFAGEPLAIPSGKSDDDSAVSELWQEMIIAVNVQYQVTGGEYA